MSYLEFARTRPGMHALMFESDLLQRSPPPQILIPVATRTYELLWRAVEGAFPQADQRWVKQRTVTMLSTIVGFRVLDNVGRFKPFMINPLTRRDLVEAVLDAAIGGSPPLRPALRYRMNRTLGMDLNHFCRQRLRIR